MHTFDTRRGLLGPASLALLALLVPVSAQSNWVDFNDETASRLVLTHVPLNDALEKDVAVADVDNDGDQDLVVVRKTPFSVPGGSHNILLINEGGVLTDRTTEFAPELLNDDDARDVLFFDCNGDGWIDIVDANTFADVPRLFVNQGESGGVWLGYAEEFNWYAPAFPVPPKFCAVYDGDIDNDGDLDLYFSDYSNNLEDRLLINDGNGNFTDETSTRFPTGINNSVFGTGSFLCDFNLDGWVDILKISGSFEPTRLLVNNGAGVFTLDQDLPGNDIYMARAFEHDGDGRTDVYMVSDGQDFVARNSGTNPNGTIQWTTSTNTNSPKTGGFGGNVHFADVDRDGFNDMGVADVDVDIPGCGGRFALLRNRNPANMGMTDPNGSTVMPWNQQGTHDFAWIDVNTDGFEDLFVAHCDGYKVFILEPFASARPYGNACSNSERPVASATGVPQLGNAGFSVEVGGAAANQDAFLLVSVYVPTALVTPGGCELLVDPNGMFLLGGTHMTNASGDASVALPVPNDPGLEGLRLSLQWLVREAGGPVGTGWSLTNGLDAYISADAL